MIVQTLLGESLHFFLFFFSVDSCPRLTFPSRVARFDSLSLTAE
jgi:hypothetical protein